MDDPQIPLTRPRRAVRILSGLLLAGCVGLFLLGLTVWENRLQGRAYVVYWSWCFLLAVAAVGMAVVDLWLVRRAYRRSRRALFQQEFTIINRAGRQRPRQEEKHPE